MVSQPIFLFVPDFGGLELFSFSAFPSSLGLVSRLVSRCLEDPSPFPPFT
ncbi:unnamed protein product [Meloidogyne enterolobii]|uniref:Uncharacterized protein n=1 Tax=Meloidogyne enterolobii TaxID=390850 RepID=A0ACB0ZL05_MELEN